LDFGFLIFNFNNSMFSPFIFSSLFFTANQGVRSNMLGSLPRMQSLKPFLALLHSYDLRFSMTHIILWCKCLPRPIKHSYGSRLPHTFLRFESSSTFLLFPRLTCYSFLLCAILLPLSSLSLFFGPLLVSYSSLFRSAT
jgi:hypothetical protein